MATFCPFVQHVFHLAIWNTVSPFLAVLALADFCDCCMASPSHFRDTAIACLRVHLDERLDKFPPLLTAHVQPVEV